MKIQTILMVLVCVALMFGGTFVCTSSNHDDDDFDDDVRNVVPGIPGFPGLPGVPCMPGDDVVA
jgi:hypothetical protein